MCSMNNDDISVEDPPTHPPSAGNQTRRRVKYGLNVAVAVVAATLLVVAVNWIVERKLRQQLGPAATRWIRFDLTATRQYSLSPQTLKVLGKLEDNYEIITLLSPPQPSRTQADLVLTQLVDQARDLIDEYGQYSNWVRVDHINPAQEPARQQNVLSRLGQRYEAQLKPIDQAVRQARDALDGFEQISASQRRDLDETLKSLHNLGQNADSQIPQLVQRVGAMLLRFDAEIERLVTQTDRSLASPLPDFGGILESMRELLAWYDQQCTLASQQLEAASQPASGEAISDAVADQLLGLSTQFKQSLQRCQTALTSLHSIQRVEGYDQLLVELAQPQVVVVVGPDQVRVIPLDDMFRPAQDQSLGLDGLPQLGFQGEEKLTGALISVSLEHAPLVVFLTSGRISALGPRGVFQDVASRLRSMGFDVQQWSPTGQPGPMGQTLPPGPPPQPKPDQKTVWVVLPTEPPSPMNPLAEIGSQQIIDRVSKRLEEGDAAFLMLTVSTSMMHPSSHPMAQLVEPWGITAQLDRLILREMVGPDHQRAATTGLQVQQWSPNHPITRPLDGMGGIMLAACPLALGGSDQPGLEVWPLVTIQGKDIWAERDFQADPPPQLDPAQAGQPLTIVAAAQRDDRRIVVAAADPMWASDYVTTNVDKRLSQAGMGLAEIFGAAFPANAELFVNSVQWLAQLDQLIAASARAQDIRRIGPIANPGLLRWLLLAGMPLMVAAAAVMVWGVRRQDH